MDRRSFLQAGAIAGRGAAFSAFSGKARSLQPRRRPPEDEGPDADVAHASIARLQQWMECGPVVIAGPGRRLPAAAFAPSIAASGSSACSSSTRTPGASPVSSTTSGAGRARAARCTGFRSCSRTTSTPRTGIGTRAGSLALVGRAALQDATVARRLRAGRRGDPRQGEPERVGQLPGLRQLERLERRGRADAAIRGCWTATPAGPVPGPQPPSSAALTAAALGTETDGSIVCPSGQSGVAGIKPTVGLTSRAGVVPISAAPGHGRPARRARSRMPRPCSVRWTGMDPRDPATPASAGNFRRDYTQLRRTPNGLARRATSAWPASSSASRPRSTRFSKSALEVMRSAGANLVDVEIPSFDEYNASQAEMIVLIFEFKRDLNAYLATRRGVPSRTLADVIQFNSTTRDSELRFFGQEMMELAKRRSSTRPPTCRRSRTRGGRAARTASTRRSQTTASRRSSRRPTSRPGRRTW